MNFSEQIFREFSGREFETLALDLFRETLEMNPVYRDFTGCLGIHAEEITALSEIPFLPISFFKTQQVIHSGRPPEKVFLSSGTTGMERSRHLVADLGLYRQSLLAGFRWFYGDPAGYVILAVMPTPGENPDSSLVYMASQLISASPGSGFLPFTGRSVPGRYVMDQNRFREAVSLAEEENRRVLIIGLTWLLLDLAESGMVRDPSLIVVETGGMKGRRREMIRDEVHEIFKAGFGVESVHSEYSMSELFSQAWSTGNGLFRCPPWMKVLVREPNDPLTLAGPGQTGGISIIDLANRYSCPFIATQDLGKVYEDGTFEVLGRFDHSDLRGCSLLV